MAPCTPAAEGLLNFGKEMFVVRLHDLLQPL
jgi:hypothetical protein